MKWNFASKNSIRFNLIAVLLIGIIVITPPLIVFFCNRDKLEFSANIFINEWIKISITSVVLVVLIERFRLMQQNFINQQLVYTQLLELKKDITDFINRWDFTSLNKIEPKDIIKYNNDINNINNKFSDIKNNLIKVIEKRGTMGLINNISKTINNGMRYKCSKDDWETVINNINQLLKSR